MSLARPARVENPCHGTCASSGARSGFSLIEMLVATGVSAVLMAAVLMIVAGVSRDRKRIAALESQSPFDGIVGRVQWELTNARRFSPSPDGRSLVLIGHGGIDRGSLAPNGRLTRVVYRIYSDGPTPCLVREQQYLDEPTAPKPWRDLVATDVRSIAVSASAPIEPDSTETSARDGTTFPVPSRLLLHLDVSGTAYDRGLWVR